MPWVSRAAIEAAETTSRCLKDANEQVKDLMEIAGRSQRNADLAACEANASATRLTETQAELSTLKERLSILSNEVAAQVEKNPNRKTITLDLPTARWVADGK
jgi:hypothetical protein